MDYVIIAFVTFAFAHFIYEAIVAPSIRLKKRFELFRLRDELRIIKVRRGAALNDKHYNFLQNSINTLIRNLSAFDLCTMMCARADILHDKELAKRINEHSKVLDDCSIDAAKEIRRNIIKFARDAFVVNSGAWAVYVVPVVVLFSRLSAIKKVVKQLLSMSEPEFDWVSHANRGRTLGVMS